MCGVIGARDGRLIDFCVTYGHDASGRPLETGVGWVSSWKEVTGEKIELTSAGYPNSWAQDRIISRMVLDMESASGS